jgi:hypothetical protein
MPPRPARVHAIGMIAAPTPCYDAPAEFTGVDTRIPPNYLVKINLRKKAATVGELSLKLLSLMMAEL